jgi:hypothetical protein
MRLETATSTTNSIGGSINAAQATTRNTVSTDKDEAEGKKGAGIRGGTNENHQGTAINSGGQVVLKSGGAATMTNTETTAARGVVTEAGKGVTTATVKDRNEVLNLGVSAKNSSAGAPLAKETAPAWTPASPSKDSAAAPAGAKAGKHAAHKPAPKKPVKQAKPVIGGARKAAAPLP